MDMDLKNTLIGIVCIIVGVGLFLYNLKNHDEEAYDDGLMYPHFKMYSAALGFIAIGLFLLISELSK